MGSPHHNRFRALHQHREEIDKEVDGTVLWQEKRFRVTLEGDEAISLTAPEADLDTARRWMADSLLALVKALKPHLDHLTRDGDAASGVAEDAG